MARLGSVVLRSEPRAPPNSPSCRSCCPLSRIDLSVQKVMADSGREEEVMWAVTITWRAGVSGSAVREMVGEDVESDMVRSALSETRVGLEHN